MRDGRRETGAHDAQALSELHKNLRDPNIRKKLAKFGRSLRTRNIKLIKGNAESFAEALYKAKYGKNGSYSIRFRNGKRYHGAGPVKRMHRLRLL